MLDKPFLSLMCICGDVGVRTLGRMLKSVLCRADGPMVDEVVIGWNGKNDLDLREALMEGGATTTSGTSVSLKIAPFAWTNDFAQARNEAMSHCKGEWIVWTDSDDIVASAADPEGLKAIQAVEKTLGLVVSESAEGGGTLKDWLRQLPWNVTCVRAPYDYAIDEVGNTTVRQVRRRILRRDCYVWRLPIHELAYPLPGIIESAMDNPGLLLRHYPAADSAERLLRNKEVLDAMQERKGSPSDTSQPIDYADARHAYDVAAMNIGLGDLAAADTAIRTAISRSGDRLDTYRYRLTRAQINISRGLYETAYAEAVAATGLKSELQDAWFAAAECQYLLGQWQSCISFFEIGESKKPSLQPVDFVLAREVKPRAQAAVAYCELGEPEKGLPYAEEAAKLYPNDGLAKTTLERVRGDADKKRSIDGVLDSVEFLLSRREVSAASELLRAAASTVSLRGIQWLPRYQQARVATDHGLRHFKRDRDFGDAPPEEAKKLVTIDSNLVYYDTESGSPEDTESLVSYWCGRGHQVIQASTLPKGIAVRVRKTSRPHLTFYSPHAFTQWDPTFPEKYGLGGSESAVVYLAKELSRRGYPITVFCPTGASTGCDMGFVWKGLTAFDMRADHGILIACRAPWVLRNPDLKSPTLVWHQDNGYGSSWHWNPEIDRRSLGSLHVSDWARAGLIRELVTEQGQKPDLGPQYWKDVLGRDPFATHHVIGNGVEESWCLVNRSDVPKRNPHRVLYASDPTRGLDTLLNCWPHVVEAVPDAELHVYGDTNTQHQMPTGATATVREITFLRMRQKLHGTKGVSYRGRTNQPELTNAMLAAGVYAYPGGLMPEGYGIVLAQAAAAGCAVVFPEEGALSFIHDRTYMVPPVRTEEAAQKFLSKLIDAVKFADAALDRREISGRILAEHAWPRVADRFEQVLQQAGLVGESSKAA